MTANPTQFPVRTDRTIPVPLPAPLRLVDRDGDEWQATGRFKASVPLLECPAPTDPDDCGEGESHAWTLTQVRAWFGPLRTTQEVAA